MLFFDSLCEFILCSTSAKRVMYFLGYVDATLECNIQTCKYSDFFVSDRQIFTADLFML